MGNQPRWAWWVVGIVIPVVGILVSIQLATNSGSDDDKGQSTDTGTSAGTSAGTGGGTGGGSAPSASGGSQPPAASQPAKVLSGPVRVTISPDAKYVDLDSTPPLAQPGEKGSDGWIGFNLPELELTPEGDAIAIVPAEGPEPTRDECLQAITKRGGSDSGQLALGMRLCLQTGDGHTAYLRVIAAPSRKAVTFEATVWE